MILSAADYTGGSLRGYEKDPNVDEFERKEQLRKNKRRPIQETIEELGEGRGMLCIIISVENDLTGPIRYLWTRVRRETKRENKTKLWHRRSG